jgi:hypothetical protein
VRHASRPSNPVRTGLPVVALVLLWQTLSACGIEPELPAAATCGSQARDYAGVVVASYKTTVGAVRRLDPRQVAPARWQDLPSDHPAVLCYIAGEVAKGPPPPAKPFDLAAVAVVDGAAELVFAGYRDNTPIGPP